jgi:hypothetical protein
LGAGDYRIARFGALVSEGPEDMHDLLKRSHRIVAPCLRAFPHRATADDVPCLTNQWVRLSSGVQALSVTVLSLTGRNVPIKQSVADLLTQAGLKLETNDFEEEVVQMLSGRHVNQQYGT